MLVEEQVVLFLAGTSGLLDVVPTEKVGEASDKILTAVRSRAKETLKKIASTGTFDEKDEEKLKGLISEVVKGYEKVEEKEKSN